MTVSSKYSSRNSSKRSLRSSSNNSSKNSLRHENVYTESQLQLANDNLKLESTDKDIVSYTYHHWQLFLDATVTYRQHMKGNNIYKKLFKGFHNWSKSHKLDSLSKSRGWQTYIQIKKLIDDESLLTLIDTKSQHEEVDPFSSDSSNIACILTTLQQDLFDSQSEGCLDDSHTTSFNEHEELERSQQRIESTNRETNEEISLARLLITFQQSFSTLDSQTKGSHFIDHQALERLLDIELRDEVINDHRSERHLFMAELEKTKAGFEDLSQSIDSQTKRSHRSECRDFIVELERMKESLEVFFQSIDSQTKGSHCFDHQDLDRLREGIELRDKVIDDHRNERRVFMVKLDKMKARFEVLLQ